MTLSDELRDGPGTTARITYPGDGVPSEPPNGVVTTGCVLNLKAALYDLWDLAQHEFSTGDIYRRACAVEAATLQILHTLDVEVSGERSAVVNMLLSSSIDLAGQACEKRPSPEGNCGRG